MIAIDVTADDRRSATLGAAALARACAALREDGAVALLGAVDPEHVRRLRSRMDADLTRLLARPDAPFNWNTGNIQQTPPRDRAGFFRDVLLNDQATAVTHALLGDNVTSAFYSGNTALPNSTARQPVHVDTGHLWPEPSPPQAIVINLLLVDTDPGNGATELWLGSHRDTTVRYDAPLEVPRDAVDRRRAVRPPIQATLPAGALVLRDMRLWHAGMPNRSARPRPMIAMIHGVAWSPNHEELAFTRDCEGLFEHPVLRSKVQFVEAIDHTAIGQAYAYAADSATNSE